MTDTFFSGAATMSRMTFNRMTMGRMILRRNTLSRITYLITIPLSRDRVSRMALVIMILSIIIRSIVIMILSIIIRSRMISHLNDIEQNDTAESHSAQ
jgi:hypothetical protein